MAAPAPNRDGFAKKGAVGAPALHEPGRRDPVIRAHPTRPIGAIQVYDGGGY
jgi:hypothetical protein